MDLWRRCGAAKGGEERKGDGGGLGKRGLRRGGRGRVID